MFSLFGQCFGIMKNSRSNTSDDANCNWRSGDQNLNLATLKNEAVILTRITFFALIIMNRIKNLIIYLQYFIVMDVIVSYRVGVRF
jgi:hypothetical protein